MSGAAPGPERSVGARLPRGKGLPRTAMPPSGLGARRTRKGLAVTALGSSSCPPYPVRVVLEPGAGTGGAGRVRVDLDDAHPGRAGTADRVATTHVVALPEGAPADGHLQVLLVLGELEEHVAVH
ncbi:hypothetical protein [uncultured Pseudokineococcus sp.]|uniref:hypothetical protein n=1 Tax=uncultured Pseudokineococcus sp. TaxID=1642928 RepID=UPI002607C9F4|nr:hypothetical protein [uncultured Pseudokineococcus sp.]